jgi:hypothetical protein
MDYIEQRREILVKGEITIALRNCLGEPKLY